MSLSSSSSDAAAVDAAAADNHAAPNSHANGASQRLPDNNNQLLNTHPFEEDDSDTPDNELSSSAPSASEAQAAIGPAGTPINRRRASKARAIKDPNDRRTVFIPNLPVDVKYRELYNMFQSWDGFLKVQLWDSAAKHASVTSSSSPAAATAAAAADGHSAHNHTDADAQQHSSHNSPNGSHATTHNGVDASHSSHSHSHSHSHTHSHSHSQSNGSSGSHTSTPHVAAFVLFQTTQHAAFAIHRLQGYMFDPMCESGGPCILTARFALKNLFMSASDYELKAKRTRTDSFSMGPHNMLDFTPVLQGLGPSNTPPVASSPFQSPYPSPFTSFSHSSLMPPSASLPSSLVPVTPPHAAAPYAFFSDNTPPAANMNSPLPQMPLSMPPMPVTMSPFNHPNSIMASLNALNMQPALPMPSDVPHVGVGVNNFHSHGHHAHAHVHAHAQAAHSLSSAQAHPHPHSANPPCSALFLARLINVTDDELLQMLKNSFPHTLRDYKFMVDSKGQRIAFVQFDSVQSAAEALPRINGHMMIQAAFSKNPLGYKPPQAQQQQQAQSNGINVNINAQQMGN